MDPNPSAWLLAAAKNRALDVLRRQRTARTFAPELGRLLESECTLAPVVEQIFAPNAIKDDLLRMMFSCCHPRLAEDVQVALILHILCGFSVGEVASAFISGHAAIEKRILRAKKVLAQSKRLFDVTVPADFSARLPAVHRALYLLFSEGYHGASTQSAVRGELCHEAMRLGAVLLERPATPTTCALCALMCLTAARLPARVDVSGNRAGSFTVGSKARARRPETFGTLGVRHRTHRISCRGGDRIRSFPGSTRGGYRLENHRFAI
jgi:predicted RNA polymerase sigma factor